MDCRTAAPPMCLLLLKNVPTASQKKINLFQLIQDVQV